MLEKLNKNPKKNTTGKQNSFSATTLSSPVAQFINKDSSEVNDPLNSASKSLKSVQLFGKNDNQRNNHSNSRQLNSSPSFPAIQRKSGNNNSPKATVQANKTGLPDNVKSGVEQLSGVSLSDVKVHYNSAKPAQLQAHAYAQGTDIHVASGQEKHVPHEAWHVVQQKQGRVQATKQMKGKVPVNDDAGLENEADVMGAKSVQMAAKDNEEVIQQKSGSSNGVAQLGMMDSVRSFFGFGEKKDKKEEEFGVNPSEVEAIPEGQENKHSLITLSKNPERFNKEEKDKIHNSKTNAKKDLEVIPKGSVDGVKNVGKKRDKDGKEKGTLEKLLAKNIERNKLIGVKGGQGRAAELSGANKVQDHLGLKDSGIEEEIQNIGNVKKSAKLLDKKVSEEGIRKDTFKESLEVLDSRLNKFLMFDNSAKKSVLLKSGEGSLSDEEKWNIIQINSEFMSFIKEGSSINKIIPDNAVQTIIQVGKMDAAYDNNTLGGSVADSTNYDDGLRGNEAISNFGLDYSGYEEISENQDGTKTTSKLEGSKKVDEYGKWGALPSYVKEVGRDKEGHRKIKAVQNVFYVNVKLNKEEAENVRVPIHQNIIDYANEMHDKMINNPNKNFAKLMILEKFTKRAASISDMTLSTLSDGKSKNSEDPLTNLGMTRAGSRLITKFGTINQEYHMNGTRIQVKADSGLWLKDSTGKDIQVATCEDVQGKILFKVIDDQSDKLNAALAENKNFLES